MGAVGGGGGGGGGELGVKSTSPLLDACVYGEIRTTPPPPQASALVKLVYTSYNGGPVILLWILKITLFSGGKRTRLIRKDRLAIQSI